MHTGVYVLKYAKQLVPTDLWKEIVKNNTSGLGVANVNTVLNVNHGQGETPIEELEAFQTEHQDKAVLMYFYEALDGFKHDTDAQPFYVLKEEKGAVVAFLDGEFARHAEDNGHTSQYNAATDYLTDRVTGLYAIVRGDMAKLMDLLRAPKLAKEIEAVVGEDNSITLLGSTGEIISYGPIKNVKKETWGWATNYYGYGAAVVTKVETPVVKKTGLSVFDKKVNNPPAQTLQTVAVKEEKTPPLSEVKVDKGPGLTEATVAIHNQHVVEDANKKIYVIPDPKLDWSNNKLTKWYHSIMPSMARDAWKGRPPVETTLGELVALKMANYKVVDAPKEGLDKLKNYRAFESQQQKDVTPHTVTPPSPAQPVDNVQKTNVSLVSVIPRVPADEAKKVVAIIQGSKGTISPEEFKGMEKKYPTILDTAGLKHWDQLHRLDFTDIYNIAENRTAISVMVMNLIGQHIRMTERLNQVAAKAVEKIAL